METVDISDEQPDEPNTETKEERNVRAEIKRAIRADNLTWAHTLALSDEQYLSVATRVSICKMLFFPCALLRRPRTALEEDRAALLALHWGVFRKMKAPRHR